MLADPASRCWRVIGGECSAPRVRAPGDARGGEGPQGRPPPGHAIAWWRIRVASTARDVDDVLTGADFGLAADIDPIAAGDGATPAQSRPRQFALCAPPPRSPGSSAATFIPGAAGLRRAPCMTSQHNQDGKRPAH
jgi:hypothetical protein